MSRVGRPRKETPEMIEEREQLRKQWEHRKEINRMNKEKQQQILTNLINSLDELNEMLEMDVDFHDMFAHEVFKRNTFHKSIDEMMLDFSLMKKNL